MDGVLEAAIALGGCKVACSLLCLPTLRGSISSVSLCCSCLLLFTDLSITMFLTYLWCAAPKSISFYQSSDVITLRFMVFLSNTYGAVLMLTPLLVAVDVLVHFLSLEETSTKPEVNDEAVKEKTDPENDKRATCESGPLQDGGGHERIRVDVQVGGFLACLLLWIMCANYAVSSLTQEQATVRACLESGSSLFACLPCFLTTSSPIKHKLFWVLPAGVLLLGVTRSLGLLMAKWAQRHTQTLEPPAADHWESSVHARQPALEKTFNPDASTSTDPIVDIVEKTVARCSIRSQEFGYNSQQSFYVPNLALMSHQTSLTGSSHISVLLRQKQSEVPLNGIDAIRGTTQALPSCQSWVWQPQWESPRMRVDLTLGVICGLLVCLTPTVVSTNILLVSNLDTLAVYVVKHLLDPSHG